VVRNTYSGYENLNWNAHTYKEPSITYRSSAAIWSKTNFGPTGHHYPRSSPLPHVWTVLNASAIFFNTSWKSCSDRAFSNACDSATIT
jgi:hypothetical protein